MEKLNNIKKSTTQKLIHIFLWAIYISAPLMIIGLTFLTYYIPRVLRSKINHIVVNGSDSLYKCSIGKISVNILQGKVSIEDLNITVDSVKYLEQKLSGKIPDITFELSVLKGSVKGLKTIPLVFQKKIKINDIEIDHANIMLCRQGHRNHKKNIPNPTEESLWRILQPHIRGIYVNSIQLNKMKFLYRNSEDKKELSLTYKDCSLSLKNIRLDSIGATNSSRILFTQDIAIKIAGISYFTNDSLYNLKADSLSYSSFYKVIQLKNASISPTLPFIEFTKRKGMQVDIFETMIPYFTGKNFKLEKIFTDNEICFDTIILNKPVIKISRDRTSRPDTNTQIGKYPNEALLNAPFTLKIPIVLIKGGKLHYIERQKLTFKTGDAFFSKINGVITNITNSKRDLEKNSHCIMKLNGFFLKNGKLKVRLDFDLNSLDGNYTASAYLGPITAKELNTVFIPFVNIRLKTIDLNSGYLKFNGNNKGLAGTFRLLYKNLSIEMMAFDKKTHRTKKQGFVSFLANLVVVRAQNTAGKKEIIANNIHVERKDKQPFGNLIWELLFEGMKKIMLRIPIKNLKVEM